ncbi:MAG: urea ABC transporter ATP-binding protein UrtD [Planctomycetota bacterium]|nr:urea ABC transporter ATP-binding protein UrtD [Planctomycetota bacterium]MED5399924.1 urea ABC transporter ATP-binding protein UrtD [Planctomycetota bacterium]
MSEQLPPLTGRLGLASPRGKANIIAISALLVTGLLGIPGLYLAGVIGIETVNMLGRYLCFALLALSLDLIWGYGGMLCLCQSFFFSLGGYAMGMFLAHHGGPEGIIDATGWKLPACLYVVYPYEVGQAPEEALVPWFWKPFWSLPATLLLGMLIPGLVAAVIGFFVFRSRVRGVFFAILTQAVTLAAWLVFSMNQMMFCGTNGLTRFDRITFHFTEVIQIDVDQEALAKNQVEIGQVQKVLESYQSEHEGSLSGSGHHFTSRPRKFQNVDADFASLEVTSAQGPVKLGDIAKFDVAGWRLSDSSVKFALYIVTILSLLVVFIGCRVMIGSRFGRVLIAIRDNETRLRFAGYRPYVFKMAVFALSAMIAGLAGMLYAPQMQIFTPTNLEPKESILVVVWVAFGGRGTLSGPVAGALLVNLLYFYLTGWSPEAWPFLLGGMFVFVVLLMPEGVMGFWNKMFDSSVRESTAGSDDETDSDSPPMTDRLQALAMRQRTDTVQSHLDSPLLSVNDVHVHFDGFQALDIDHYSVPHYALNVIIGPNGAGKTTLCDVISGKTRVSQGRIEYADRDITWDSEVDIARLGVGRKFQTPTVFDGLDVRQNMELALPGRQKLVRNLQMSSTRQESDQISEILQRVRLLDDVDRPVKFLSHGQRQWLEISMLILSSPQLLLVDEPAAGLTDEETVLTAELLLELQDEHSIIVIEHDMEFVRLLNSRVTVLNEGRIIAQGSLDQVKQNPEVIEAYLGR